jgi:hypothetical protein
MSATPGRVRPVRICLGETLTIDVLGAAGTRLRVRGRLDAAPGRYTGDVASWLVLVDAPGPATPLRDPRGAAPR